MKTATVTYTDDRTLPFVLVNRVNKPPHAYRPADGGVA